MSRTQTARAVAVGLVATAAGAVAAGLWRSRRASRPAPAMTWTCACGERYRVSGVGRHRIHWPLEASDDDPVVGNQCPSCGRPLADGTG